MSALRYRQLWQWLGALEIALLAYSMLTTITVAVDVPDFDKLVHWSFYALLMSWYAQLYPQGRQRCLALLGVLALGVGLEYLQQLNPTRSFDYYDILANVVGVFSGLLLMRPPGLRYLYRLEAHLP